MIHSIGFISLPTITYGYLGNFLFNKIESEMKKLKYKILNEKADL